MANQVYANNASAVLASGITDSATTITVASGQGASFPTVSGGNWAYITLVDTSGNLEIVKCTSHSAAADTFTCTRGQDGTTARAFSANDLFELRVTKATLDTLRDVASQTSGTLDGVIIGGGTPAAITGTTITANTGFSGALNGTVGATTPATGAFTTLTATGNVTLGDASGDSVTINASTVGCANGLNFDSNTFVIDSTNNRVGIGTSSPAQKLHVYGNAVDTTAQITKNGTDSILVGVDSEAYVGAGYGAIAFRTGGFTSAYDKAKLDTSGNFLVGVSSATTNGGKIETSNGITFPATQSACSNANTLDDYEEGTWTPSLSFTTSSTGLTYSIQKGKYTKIGNLVTIQCHLALSSLGSASGTPRITGLPFSGSTDTTNLTYNGSTALANYGNMTFGEDPWVYISPSNPSYIFFFSQSGVVTEADMTGTSYFTFCMTYFV